MRIAIPTKDRQGTLPLALTSIAQWASTGDEICLYDDGHRPATADYTTRFALDMAMQRGATVVVRRGKPLGIAQARARILADAHRDSIQRLLMVDDDIVIDRDAVRKLSNQLDDFIDAHYVVPTIALANNEAGVKGFTDTGPSASHPQYQLEGKGAKFLRGGAWTCAILLDLFRFDVQESVTRLVNGPKVVEDYTLTVPLIGYVALESTVWHVMTHEQGEREWETLALAELRRQVGESR